MTMDPAFEAHRALAEELRHVRNKVDRMDDLLEEFLPLIRAYLDPEQAGPRGYFMRKRLASTNGRADHG